MLKSDELDNSAEDLSEEKTEDQTENTEAAKDQDTTDEDNEINNFIRARVEKRLPSLNSSREDFEGLVKCLIEKTQNKYTDYSRRKILNCMRLIFNEFDLKYSIDDFDSLSNTPDVKSKTSTSKTCSSSSSPSSSSSSTQNAKSQTASKSPQDYDALNLSSSKLSSGYVSTPSPSSSSSSASSSQKHASNNNDLKSSKKQKTSNSPHEAHSNKSPNLIPNSTALFSSANTANSSSASLPASNPFGAFGSSPFFDPEFLRLAAASASNPLFRFPDFGALTSNSYFNNIFRPNLASSPQPLSSPSFVAPTPPLALSVGALTSKSSYMGHEKPQREEQQTNVQNGNSEQKLSAQNGSSSSKSSAGLIGQKYQKSINLSSNISNSNGTSESPKLSNGNHGNHCSPATSSSKLKLSSKFSKLNGSEIQTIKNLISSYKESAAFLSRSAEELEQLISEFSEN